MGLMGSGKSIIGRNLSDIYNIKFIDTDSEIENYSGKSINDIFTNYGEKYFRKLEEQICLEILENKNCIISLGGGSILNFKIRNIINKNSYSIYLKVDNDVLYKRLKNSKKRPLLKYADKRKVIESMFEKRKNFYNKANLIVENNFEKKKVINKIQEKFRNL